MKSVAIVTDSAADLPVDFIREKAVTVVPLQVTFGDQTYLDGRDLTPALFYEKLATSASLPTTSQASPGEFCEVYRELLKTHQHVVSIHISSQLSGTVASARMAREIVDSERITVIDSRNASLGQGLYVMAAVEMAEGGASAQEITSTLEQRVEKAHSVFTIDTLEYLVKGGRLSASQGFLGSMLKIKPILHVSPNTDGRIEPLDKVRGRRRALERLIDITINTAQQPAGQVMGVSHSLADDIEHFLSMLKEKVKPQDIVVSEIGAAVGAHVGKGTIAVFFLE